MSAEYFICQNCHQDKIVASENIWSWEGKRVCNVCLSNLIHKHMSEENIVYGYVHGSSALPHAKISIGGTVFKATYIRRKVTNRWMPIFGGYMKNVTVEFRDHDGNLWRGTCWNYEWNEATKFRKV